MIAATVLAVFFVPVFFVLMQRLSEFRFKTALEWIRQAKPITVPHAGPVGVHLHANGQSRHGSSDEALETAHGAH